MRTEGIEVTFTESAVTTIADIAFRVNESLENIGARRLHTIMERVFEDLSFDAPEMETEHVEIDEDYVRMRLEKITQNQDLSRYIL